MKHLLVALLLTLLPGTLAWGAKEQDFVALMMEHISSKPADYPTTDYENITVSPTMISYMLDMMDNDSDNSSLLPGNSAQNLEQLRQLLKDVKSLRIFIDALQEFFSHILSFPFTYLICQEVF